MGKNLDLVNNWYPHFDKQELDYVVSVFADDAILIVGDGDSEGAVPYGGRFAGIAQIKHYYAGRFMLAGASPFGIIRPFCGLADGIMREFGRWVIIGAKIEDTTPDRTSSIYKGDFLHVWSFNPHGKVASLSMYFDTDGN
jgi:hypothetical protein